MLKRAGALKLVAAWEITLVELPIHHRTTYRYHEPVRLGPHRLMLRHWTQAFILGTTTDSLSLLKDINSSIPAWVFYQSREHEGTQSPTQTLARGWGSCRDLATLVVEAVRTLGFGARIVSGYLHYPRGDMTGADGSGATHAWAEVYVPGAGWITFDPTNRSVGGVNLIPVAVGFDIRQVTPIAGSFTGMSDAFGGMKVEVDVR
jgi:transglutaminase-like putative cysteine protease